MGAREKWLLSILTGIFIAQATVLIYGVSTCAQIRPQVEIAEVCPQLGERFDSTFATMIATTLALLTGSAVATAKVTTRRTPPKE